jgi:hypothetical protein
MLRGTGRPHLESSRRVPEPHHRVSCVINATYAVVGFGEALPPQTLLLWARYGGKAAIPGPQKKSLEGCKPAKPPAE